jgi:DNA repair protein RadC
MHNKNDKAYNTEKPMTENQVLEAAAEILACRYIRE